MDLFLGKGMVQLFLLLFSSTNIQYWIAGKKQDCYGELFF